MIKVADFGLSESIDVSKDYFRQSEQSVAKLPIKWLALESIMDGIFSEKTDVVSSQKEQENGSSSRDRCCKILCFVHL